MKYQDNSTDWLFFAESDLKTARAMLKERIPHMVCFHAQQAIEKSLKALLRNKNKPIPKTHSLTKLAVEVKKIKRPVEINEEEIIFVNQFYSPTRYPDTLPGTLPESLPTRAADGTRAPKVAQQIYEEVKSLVSN